jgi:2,4-dienoyl-CoA reductase-like NADH-dependent reductase (Old Yellow Enzyme family)
LSNYKHIFTPLKIGRLTVKNRIETAPCVPFLASIDGDVTRELIEWERALARGGAGIVTIGDTPIMNETAARVGHILNLGIDRTIGALNRLAEAIQRYGAKASIELTYFDPSKQYSPNDLSLEEIQYVIESYAKAAFRCLAAGMDMIMIHGAHGHLISQFLSTRKNLRNDAYGGGFENRVRFATEVLEAIRNKVGDGLAIEYRKHPGQNRPDTRVGRKPVRARGKSFDDSANLCPPRYQHPLCGTVQKRAENTCDRPWFD